MALGRRQPQQIQLFVPTAELVTGPGHPFYAKLNEILAEAGFDAHAEELCAPYSKRGGRPSIPPGVYFRMLLIGYFEGFDSQRGIAWRCADSLGLRAFLGVPLTEATPVHASMTIIRQRLPESVFEAPFRFVLGVQTEQGLVRGQTLGIDATTLEANAAMKSIVRKDTGVDWNEYLRPDWCYHRNSGYRDSMVVSRWHDWLEVLGDLSRMGIWRTAADLFLGHQRR